MTEDGKYEMRDFILNNYKKDNGESLTTEQLIEVIEDAIAIKLDTIELAISEFYYSIEQFKDMYEDYSSDLDYARVAICKKVCMNADHIESLLDSLDYPLKDLIKEIADKEASKRSKANYDLFELLDVKGNKSVYDIMRQYATDEPTKKFLNGGMIL